MKCTQVALQVCDVDRSIAFYTRYCDMQVVHRRESDGVPVVWLGWGEDLPRFVIVLIGRLYTQTVRPPLQHLGLAVDHRDDVDAVHARAQADGLPKLWDRIDGGPIVGYYCGLPDADGNMVEFSHGQRIG